VRCSVRYPAPCYGKGEFMCLEDSRWLCAPHAPDNAEEFPGYAHIDTLRQCARCEDWYDAESTKQCARSWCDARFCAECYDKLDECPECGLAGVTHDGGVDYVGAM
jgi:hypothetical protein